VFWAYWAVLRALEAKGDTLLTEEDWNGIDVFSDTDRLWYRVGALVAARIETAYGRERLVEIVSEGPATYFAASETAVGHSFMPFTPD